MLLKYLSKPKHMPYFSKYNPDFSSAENRRRTTALSLGWDPMASLRSPPTPAARVALCSPLLLLIIRQRGDGKFGAVSTRSTHVQGGKNALRKYSRTHSRTPSFLSLPLGLQATRRQHNPEL